MFCSKCGKALPDDAIFCNGCGTRVAVNVPDPSPAKAANEPLTAPEQPQYAPSAAPEQPQFTPSAAPEQPQFAPNAAPGQPQFAPNAAPGQPQFAPNGAPGQPQFVPNGAPGEPQFAPRAPVKKSLPKFLTDKPSIWSWACTFLAFMFTLLPIYTSGFTGRFSMFSGGIFSISVAAGLGMVFMILGILVFLARFAASIIDFNKIIKIKLNIEALAQLAFIVIEAFVLFLAFIGAVATYALHLWIWWYLAFAFTGGAILFTFMPNLIKWPKE